jgi:hypothetical protein
VSAINNRGRNTLRLRSRHLFYYSNSRTILVAVFTTTPWAALLSWRATRSCGSEYTIAGVHFVLISPLGSSTMRVIHIVGFQRFVTCILPWSIHNPYQSKVAPARQHTRTSGKARIALWSSRRKIEIGFGPLSTLAKILLLDAVATLLPASIIIIVISDRSFINPTFPLSEHRYITDWVV